MNVHTLPIRSRIGAGVKPDFSSRYASKSAVHDPRWRQVQAALSKLRANGRHAVRIVDADCGAGTLLLNALDQARRLGFTAIEGHGIDRSPLLIGRARAAADRVVDPAIGVDFEVADMVAALRDEQDLPADILICHDVVGDRRPEVMLALCNAGRIVIDDQPDPHARGNAA